MKYTELSIGNLVYQTGNIIKVESITKRKVGYHLKPNESCMHYARMSEILPIPITEEILKNMVLKKCLVEVATHTKLIFTIIIELKW